MKGKMVLVTVGMLLMMPSFAISITPNHIVINEIYYSNEDKSLWWFEIYNPTYQIINTTNWTIWFYSINGPIYFPKQLKELLPQEYVIMCASKESFLKKWHMSSTIRVFEIPFGDRWDRITINSDSVPEKGLRIPPLKEGHSWARYKGGYDTDSFNRDFYEESSPTPGYENRIEEREHMPSVIDYSYEKPSHIWTGALSGVEPKSSPEELIQKFKEISKDEYSKISASDDERLYVVSDPAGEGHPYALYEFNIKYKGNITLIWEGYGVNPYWNIRRYACLHLWNYSKSGWDLMINSTFEAIENYSSDYTADKTLLFNLSTISSCYVKNNYMYLLAIGPYGEGYSSGILATDHVAIKHEAVPEKFSLWLYLIIAIAILILLVVALFKIRRK